MTSMKLKFFTFLQIFLYIFCLTDAKISKNATFVATEEWQEIPKGMAIPAGLHVRINFQTRKREAKLLDKSEKQENENNALTLKDDALSSQDDERSDKRSTSSSSKKKSLLSDALKDLQKDGKSLRYTPESLSQIKRDFKAAKRDVVENFESMRQHFQSDAEIITLLIEEYLNITNPEQKSFQTADERSKRQHQILDSFDYMLHQIDNSMLFVSQGGLDILLPIVANETRPLRVKAMRVLGVLTQNNPKVQNEVYKQNFPTYLLKTLISSSNTEELSTALYAFGSLIRKFPLAQRSLLSTSGTQALVSIINRECELKVKVKAVVIISDILEEYHHVLSTPADERNTEILEEYRDFRLYKWLTFNEFCESVELAVIDEALQFYEQPDLVDRFVEAMRNSYLVCETKWSPNSEMHKSLSAIENQYKLSGDDYQVEISQRISELLTSLQSKRRDEL